MRSVLLATALFLFSFAQAQKKSTVTKDDQLKTQASTSIQSNYDQYKTMAFQIWDYAEVGYKEVKSSALLQQTLKH